MRLDDCRRVNCFCNHDGKIDCPPWDVHDACEPIDYSSVWDRAVPSNNCARCLASYKLAPLKMFLVPAELSDRGGGGNFPPRVEPHDRGGHNFPALSRTHDREGAIFHLEQNSRPGGGGNFLVLQNSPPGGGVRGAISEPNYGVPYQLIATTSNPISNYPHIPYKTKISPLFRVLGPHHWPLLESPSITSHCALTGRALNVIMSCDSELTTVWHVVTVCGPICV